MSIHIFKEYNSLASCCCCLREAFLRQESVWKSENPTFMVCYKGIQGLLVSFMLLCQCDAINNMISPSCGIVGTLNGAVFWPFIHKMLISHRIIWTDMYSTLLPHQSGDPVCIQWIKTDDAWWSFTLLFLVQQPIFSSSLGKKSDDFFNFPILNVSWLKICFVFRSGSYMEEFWLFVICAWPRRMM